MEIAFIIFFLLFGGIYWISTVVSFIALIQILIIGAIILCLLGLIGVFAT